MKNQNNNLKNKKIIAIIVTYNPSLDILIRLFNSIATQANNFIIIDNGSANAEQVKTSSNKYLNSIFINLPENKGIAFAQNVGFRIAESQGASYVLTLDQDSLPSSKMVSNLASIFDLPHKNNAPIAAVGPILKDENTQLHLPLFSYKGGKKQRIIPTHSHSIIDLEFLVSSGTLLSMEALKEVGLMREELFISYVDVEWCLRARSYGYRIVANCATTMQHSLGDHRIKIGHLIIPLHSPLRHFYLMRSGIYMQKLLHLSQPWRRADRRQLLRSFILFSLIGLPSPKEFISMCRGLHAGFKMKVKSIPTIEN
ncbi:glycosyltransferase family 2 protein [Craterilacuibacter sinensis]|uniref:Rhamnosyltransferase n=1 Tax=Craterilacuibacter sinensis TaxID=2686017 RepID=A0A845BR66_9NEIS|nr:glycosyltransferase family 2 protein [Craterilacuibacter sinensis]MXR37658.1 rhamnosyltransferase [Craterilacuibacter sinensis]